MLYSLLDILLSLQLIKAWAKIVRNEAMSTLLTLLIWTSSLLAYFPPASTDAIVASTDDDPTPFPNNDLGEVVHTYTQCDTKHNRRMCTVRLDSALMPELPQSTSQYNNPMAKTICLGARDILRLSGRDKWEPQ